MNRGRHDTAWSKPLFLFVDHIQVKWVNKGVERGETLVSISTDGRVVEWSMKKGLSYSPLMVLKRIGQLSPCCRVVGSGRNPSRIDTSIYQYIL